MKLTKRGKRVRAVALLLVAVVIGFWIRFNLTHHWESYNCRQVAEGTLCDTYWVHN